MTWGNRGGGGKSAGFLYGWASEDGVWAGCVHWFGQICTFKKERPGEMGVPGANLPEPVHLTRVPQCALPGHRHQPRTGRQLQTADCAPPAHLLPQYCTLLGKTRHRHRPRTGRRLQTVPPRTLPPRHRRFVPPARPIRHCQFVPPAHPTRYYQTTRKP